MDAQGAALQMFEQLLVYAGKKSLQAERLDFVEEAGASDGVQMRGDFVQQQYRIWR